MIHNLTAAATRVYITWEMDFIPLGAKAARGMHEVKTQWLDVMGGTAYPVFDAIQGTGHNGARTFPDDVPNAYGGGPPRNTWTADHDGTLVGTAGHLHPGGLWTDLKVTRAGRTVEVFRSRAHYYEPAGAVSWDVSMTATPPNWRVAIKKGDVLSVSGTYDSRTHVVVRVDGDHAAGDDGRPGRRRRPLHDQHRGQGRAHPRPPARERPSRRVARPLPDATKLPDGPRSPPSTSRASRTGRATCRSRGPSAARPWSAPASR